MKSTDKPAFALALTGCLTEIYDKHISPALLEVWYNALSPCALADVQAALTAHIADPERGQFPPKPADIIRQLQARPPDEGDSGHPGPEEAWGMLIHFVNDEQETGLYTEPMRHAWEACDPILKLGDEVGARMCFLETYRKALKRAVETRNPPQWILTMGSDVERRKLALQDAVAAKRISADYAQSLLPAPVASMDHLAGLLEHDGPQADPDQPSLSERLRDLAKKLRASQADEQTPAMQDEEKRRKALDAKKAEIESHRNERMRGAV